MEEENKKTKVRNRPDQTGKHEAAFKRNRTRVLLTETICGICGRPVDKSLRYPDPMSPCIDHIIPIDRGGHPSDIDNLQLAHWKCNRAKSNKLLKPKDGNDDPAEGSALANRDLPLSMDWSAYKGHE